MNDVRTEAPPPREAFTARTPADLAALACAVIGFRPEESLVVLTFGGPPFHARIDLARTAAEADEVVRAVAHPLVKHSVPRVALVLVGEAEPCATTFAAMHVALRALGVDLVEALRLPRYPEAGEDDVEGVSLTTGDRFLVDPAHRFLAQMIMRGEAVTRTRRDVEAEALAVDDAAAAVERGWERYQAGDGAGAWCFADRARDLGDESDRLRELRRRLADAEEPEGR